MPDLGGEPILQLGVRLRLPVPGQVELGVSDARGGFVLSPRVCTIAEIRGLPFPPAFSVKPLSRCANPSFVNFNSSGNFPDSRAARSSASAPLCQVARSLSSSSTFRKVHVPAPHMSSTRTMVAMMPVPEVIVSLGNGPRIKKPIMKPSRPMKTITSFHSARCFLTASWLANRPDSARTCAINLSFPVQCLRVALPWSPADHRNAPPKTEHIARQVVSRPACPCHRRPDSRSVWSASESGEAFGVRRQSEAATALSAAGDVQGSQPLPEPKRCRASLATALQTRARQYPLLAPGVALS